MKHVVFILDKSGSMSNCFLEAINGIRRNLNEIKASKEECLVSLVTFSSIVEPIFFNKPIAEVNELFEFRPSGWTAFYDAIGYSMTRMMSETDVGNVENNYLIFMVTDGQENRSKRYNENQVKEIIGNFINCKNWKFVLLGANIDLNKYVNEWNFPASNIAEFINNAQSTDFAMKSSSHKMRAYLSSAIESSNANFYNDEEIITSFK